MQSRLGKAVSIEQMLILISFAFLAGLATVLAPCVLPVLPVVLASGATGGRKRPLGIATGIVVAFTISIFALGRLIQCGITADSGRWVAVVVLTVVGLVLLVPAIGERFEAWVSRFLPQRQVKGEGFWGGFLVGAALGLAWTPCVGPIMAAVITLAGSSFTIGLLLITLAFGLGAAVPLFLLALGASAWLKKLRGPKLARLNQIFGAVTLLVALALLMQWDRSVQTWFIERVPAFAEGITAPLEGSDAVQRELERLGY